jgi:hypothetical protein
MKSIVFSSLGFLCPDPRQQQRRRFVVWVLGHQLPFKGALEDRLAQALGAGQVGLDGSLNLGDDGETTLDFFDDAALFSEPENEFSG